MPDEKLGVKQRAVMLVLMAEGRELSNTEMDERHGLRLDGQDRRRLNDLRLVESSRSSGRAPYVHELTGRGWRWCADELFAGRPKVSREESLGKALYAVLAGLGRYLDHAEKGLADVFGLVESVEDRIRSTYGRLAREPGDYVSLTDLRRALDGTPRAEVDEALRELNRTRRAILVPDDDQASLTDEDRAAALRVGNQDKHLMAIEPR